jgi:hypothetical protein
MELVQIVHVTVEVAILIAVIKATMTIARLEFRVELMWEDFSRRMKIIEDRENGEE